MQVNKTNCELSLVKNYKFEMMKNTDKLLSSDVARNIRKRL
jgi:hypothetical protein